MAWIRKWHARTDSIFASASAGLVMVMMLLTTVDVVERYLFSNPVPGSYEFMQFMLGGVAFFTFAYVQYKKGHITITLVRERLSARVTAILDIIFLILMLAIFAAIGWYGAKGALEAWRIGDVTIGVIELPLGPAKMVVPVGSGLLCLRLVSQIIGSIAQLGGGTNSDKESS